MAMKLIKLTAINYDGPLYINRCKIVTLSRGLDGNGGSNTVIGLEVGYSQSVSESLPEVLALMEDKDPYPAKVLFGSK